jgi:hypothetical protein
VVVAIVIVAGGQSSDGSGSSTSGPVVADTSGAYSELVARANGLYDQGITAFGKNDATSGTEYFKAAAEVYRAAWKKQSGDPSVGTDLAVSLFYAQHHDEAIRQIEVVLKKNPISSRAISTEASSFRPRPARRRTRARRRRPSSSWHKRKPRSRRP